MTLKHDHSGNVSADDAQVKPPVRQLVGAALEADNEALAALSRVPDAEFERETDARPSWIGPQVVAAVLERYLDGQLTQRETQHRA